MESREQIRSPRMGCGKDSSKTGVDGTLEDTSAEGRAQEGGCERAWDTTERYTERTVSCRWHAQ